MKLLSYTRLVFIFSYLLYTYKKINIKKEVVHIKIEIKKNFAFPYLKKLFDLFLKKFFIATIKFIPIELIQTADTVNKFIVF